MIIYEALEKINNNDSIFLDPTLFTNEIEDELDTEFDRKLWIIVKNISSIGLRIKDDSVTFHPMIEFGNERTFSVEDLTEEDFALLKKMDFNRIPLLYRARIGDVLWNVKKDYCSAGIAAKSYYEIFITFLHKENRTPEFDMLRRAICISAQINNQGLHDEICNSVLELIKNSSIKDDSSLLLNLMNILMFQKFGDMDIYIDISKQIIELYSEDYIKTEKAYAIISQCLENKKDFTGVKNTNILLGDYFVNLADKYLGKDMKGAMTSERFLQKAIKLYKDNGATSKRESTIKKLVVVQKEIPKSIYPITLEMDVSNLRDTLKSNFNGLTAKESIAKLITIIGFLKKEDIKSQVIESFNKNPLSFLCEGKIINHLGQTEFVLPPLDLSKDSDENVMNLHINRRINNNTDFIGNLFVSPILKKIRSEHEITDEDIEFLVKGNPIIPPEREGIFASGIMMIMKGQYYEGVSILALQVESLFRYIANCAESLTITVNNDGSFKEKTLSSIFESPELLECYDNDILFFFKALLNEPSGSNIRNKIAHGIVDEETASSGVYLYFAVAVMKLLSLTSDEYYKMLSSNERLKKLDTINEDDLIIFK